MAYLRCIPNLTIFAPRDEIELRNILYTCQLKPVGPVAIRYPRGQGITVNWKKPFKPIEIGKATPLKSGEKLAILSIGTMAQNVSEAIENIASKAFISHYDMGFVKPLDEKCLLKIFKTHQQIITVEEGCISGGFGSAILEFAAVNNFKNPIKIIGIPDAFIDQGKVSILHQKCNLSVSALEEQINTILMQLD
jgi:1-deoxy-D-xylulose-5-phosphate synthase